MMRKIIEIENGDRLIDMTVWSNPMAGKALIIAPAIGVSRKFYSGIAEFFSSNGYNVVLLDYARVETGMARLSDWSLDISQAINYVDKQFQEQDIYFLGHSMAGQLLPLAENANKIRAAFLVTSQNVSNRNWTSWSRLKVDFFWYVVIPLFVNLFGFLPGAVYGGKSLPGGIARDWRKWGLSKHGILSAIPNARPCYDTFNVPVKFISFDNDLFAPPKAVKAIFNSYGSTIKEHQHFTAEELGVSGHFNFFRKKHSDSWTLIKDWFASPYGANRKVA